MKNSFLFVVMVLMITCVSSCKTSNDVVSNHLIQKRKYLRGYHLNAGESKRQTRYSLANHQEENERAFEREETSKTLTSANEKKEPASVAKEVLVQETAKSGLMQFVRERRHEKQNLAREITQRISLSNTSPESPSLFDQQSKKTVPLAVLGVVFGLVGLIVAGILFGITSITLGIISLVKISNAPDYYKGTGFAIASIILGVLDILGAIIVIALLLG